MHWTPEQWAAWDEWVASRPPEVRQVAERLLPGKYRLCTTDQVVHLHSFGEGAGGVTVTVNIYPEDNPSSPTLALWGSRSVFGIDPDELEPLDIPTRIEEVENQGDG